jgi:hypothetical protein
MGIPLQAKMRIGHVRSSALAKVHWREQQLLRLEPISVSIPNPTDRQYYDRDFISRIK